MKVLVAGCSLSSGWGFEQGSQDPAIWPNLLDAQVINVAQTSASDWDIFLSSLHAQQHEKFDLVLNQWTALDRITVQTSLDSLLDLTKIDPTLPQPVTLKHIPLQDLYTFSRTLTMISNSWKALNDLLIMIEILQHQPTPNYFVNGLLPWESDFFVQNNRDDVFTRSLLTIDTDPAKIKHMLTHIKQRLQQQPWINLEQSWAMTQIDSVSTTDQHPGAQSQILFAEQIKRYIKENTCQI